MFAVFCYLFHVKQNQPVMLAECSQFETRGWFNLAEKYISFVPINCPDMFWYFMGDY